MVDVNAKQELEKARSVLTDMLLQQEQLAIAIAKQKSRVAAWAELCNDSDVAEAPIDFGGLSDSCRVVLRAASKEWLNVAEIQEGLKKLRFPLDEYKSPSGSIMTTVNRMVDSGEVIPDQHSETGTKRYKWAGLTVKQQMIERLDENRRNFLAGARAARERALAVPPHLLTPKGKGKK
jgi:hypothetical protein